MIVADVAAMLVCTVAAVFDLRTQRIPNWLTFGSFACALVLVGVLGGFHGLLLALASAAIGLAVFGVPAAFDLIGMGDVKLVVVLGALLGWPLAISFVLYVTLSGGVIALVYALRRGQAVANNLVHLRAAPQAVLHRMPYALAIAAGCAWAIGARYLESLRLVAL